MKKKNIFLAVWTIGLLSLTTSCSNWLDVQPKTSISEEELFSRELGFKEALTGMYIQMGSIDLYGRELTYGFVDVLAQRYRISDIDYTDENLYTFPSTMNEGYINRIWARGYNLIANLNNYLMWVDRNKEIISTPGYHDIMKGEALGLRGLIYFDLLRLWGPIYKDAPSSPAIPYRTLFDRIDKSLVPANVVMDSIVNDLKRAEILLQNDPLYMEFPKDAAGQEEGLDDFLRYRYKRMNRYAVKALLARVYMYKNDVVNAAKYAHEVIDAVDENHSTCFKLVPDNSVDRLFSTEIIFALSVNKFADRVKDDFNLLSYSKYHVLEKEYINEIYDVTRDGYNDMRVRDGQGFLFSINGAYSLKYDQNAVSSFALENTIPLIRLPEMYYIVAECESWQNAHQWLTTIRSTRGADDLIAFTSEKEKMENIEKEYRKEFYAEGQLWYFYKRHGYKTFLHCPLNYDMTEKNYRFSIPDDEVELGTIN